MTAIRNGGVHVRPVNGSRGRSRLPAEPGGYALAFRLDETIRVKPGALGMVELPAGHYLYMGSALSGLAPRLARHLRRRKKRHWHIDALTSVSRAEQVWWSASDTRLECEWTASALADPEASVPIPGFGSSDCRCKSHLVRLDSEAARERVYRGVVALSPGTNRLDVPERLTGRFLSTS
ncbi:MAG: GIY-YIG nuclease family protein [Dehalococcoidia bacterium]|jgi:sugar fermentation stimulation protein A|nr:GIY-YIG nuclease family protein [Dehalococcoidia bacterium]